MMVLVIGDTHVYDRAFQIPRFIYEWIDRADEVWHTGDVSSEEFYEELKILCGNKLRISVGNCDSGSIVRENNREHFITIGDYKIWLHHGDHEDIPRYDLRAMVAKAKEKGVNTTIFGHWHQPISRELSGIWMINPGSVTDPKQF